MSAANVLISGYYGFENLGDELICQTLIDFLKRNGFNPIVLSANPEETSTLYDVDSIQRTDMGEIWQTLDECCALISGGGGLFQDSTGPASPIYYGGIIQLARWRHVPVAFFGQGIGPLKTGIGRWMTQRALQNSQLIMLRDVKSQTLAQHWVERTQNKVELIADPVWVWPHGDAAGINPAGPLGLSLRSWPSMGSEHIDYLARQIAKLPVAQQHGVALIDCQSGLDIVPLAKAENVLKHAGIPTTWHSGVQAIHGIAACGQLIAMRFHAVLLGAQYQLPTIAIPYDPKVQQLASQLQLGQLPIETIMGLDAQELASLFSPAEAAAMSRLKQSALYGFQQLEKWLMTASLQPR